MADADVPAAAPEGADFWLCRRVEPAAIVRAEATPAELEAEVEAEACCWGGAGRLPPLPLPFALPSAAACCS